MKKKFVIISLLTLISIIAIIPKSYGAISSKPTTVTDGSNVLVNRSVSDYYALCQQMKSNGESLYGTTVNPHLATNKDWGAVSYLSNSIYGTNTAGQNQGIQITINGVKYYSTTGNASGVMNWGSNPNKEFYSYTSALIKKYMDNPTSNSNIMELKTSADNNAKYVEVINTGEFNNENTLGMAMSETMNYSFGQCKRYNTTVNNPASIRQGFFGFCVGDYTGTNSYGWLNATGGSFRGVTFRPVVWN